MKRTVLLLTPIVLVAALVAAPTAARAGGFQPLSVSLQGNGAGSVTSSPAGIDCPATSCFASWGSGTSVMLTETPGATSVFTSWGGDCSGTSTTCIINMDTTRSVSASFAAIYRPDGWIKLCGLNLGCTDGPPPPHPWKGDAVYNTTGLGQTVAVRVRSGDEARFWIQLQNDGVSADTVTIDGCSGTRRFVIRSVVVGKHKRPASGATDITGAFKHDAATFDLAASSASLHQYFTLDIVARTAVEGISYSCPMTITSSGDPTYQDQVVAKLTTH
jgi:hypothetical protein